MLGCAPATFLIQVIPFGLRMPHRKALDLRAPLAAAALAMLLTATTEAQFSRDPLTNYLTRQSLGMKSIGDYLGDAIESASQFTALKAKLAGQLTTARQRFWQLYPDKPGFEQARAEFGRLLRDKDNYYLFIRISKPLNNPGFNWLTGGEVDDGISRHARDAFEIWREQVEAVFFRDLGRMLQIFANPALGKAEMEKLDPLYQSYVVRRDWEDRHLLRCAIEFRNRAAHDPANVHIVL